MSNRETIDNFLFDEENRYTQADDLWDDYFAERDDEIDMYWLYIVANDMNLNQQTDPKLKSPFWRIIENTNPNLFKAEPRAL